MCKQKPQPVCGIAPPFCAINRGHVNAPVATGNQLQNKIACAAACDLTTKSGLMTDPAASTNGVSKPSTRNPRRRLRKDSEETGTFRQQPQRKRSKLSRETYKSIGNDVEALQNGSISAIDHEGDHGDMDHGTAKATARGKLLAGPTKRIVKYDGSKVLVRSLDF